MSTTTSRLGLTKPVVSEYYDLSVWNGNSDLIDSKVALLAKTSTVSLLADSWVGSASPWSQEVVISGVGNNTKIDLCPDTATVATMLASKTSAIFAENENGTITIYAVGKGKPNSNISVQAILLEIELEA